MTRFGIVMQGDRDFAAALRQVEHAEELGYDAVYVSEHHNYDGYVPNPFTALAAVATRTERIRLATYIAILPLYHPVQLAEQAAMVDRISDGRLALGLGLGYVPEEFHAVGIPYGQKVARMEEGIPLLRRLFTEEDVHHEGKAFRFSHATIHPKPLQQPMPPIWVGGWVEPAIRRAARLADLWVPGATADFDVLKWCFDIFLDERAKLGMQSDGIEFAAARELFCGRDRDDAKQRGGRHFFDFYKDTYLKWPHPYLKERERQFNYNQLVDRRFIIGGPEDCITAIEEFRLLGIEEFALRMQPPGVTDEDARDSMVRFAEEVIPHFSKDKDDAKSA